MKEFLFSAEIWLPCPAEEAFSFFSDARNFEQTVPPCLQLEVLTPTPITMQTGTMIDYWFCAHGLPIRWLSEIREWDPPHRYVSVQRKGPFRLWHHTHTFTEKKGGTLCTDVVHYRPFGGELANALFVRRDIERVFNHRLERMMEILL